VARVFHPRVRQRRFTTQQRTAERPHRLVHVAVQLIHGAVSRQQVAERDHLRWGPSGVCEVRCQPGRCRTHWCCWLEPHLVAVRLAQVHAEARVLATAVCAAVGVGGGSRRSPSLRSVCCMWLWHQLHHQQSTNTPRTSQALPPSLLHARRPVLASSRRGRRLAWRGVWR
jgi:hypothetical protein